MRPAPRQSAKGNQYRQILYIFPLAFSALMTVSDLDNWAMAEAGRAGWETDANRNVVVEVQADQPRD